LSRAATSRRRYLMGRKDKGQKNIKKPKQDKSKKAAKK
jgi:hypothetical protein